jgi:hypothetical protein
MRTATWVQASLCEDENMQKSLARSGSWARRKPALRLGATLASLAFVSVMLFSSNAAAVRVHSSEDLASHAQAGSAPGAADAGSAIGVSPAAKAVSGKSVGSALRPSDLSCCSTTCGANPAATPSLTGVAGTLNYMLHPTHGLAFAQNACLAPDATLPGVLPAGNHSAGMLSPVKASARPASWTTHYWYAASYTGTNYTQSHTVQILYTSIQVPGSEPAAGDDYNVLLSAFDSLGYYDQVGLTDYTGNPYNTWAVNWNEVSYGGGTCGGGIAGAGYYTGLQLDQLYTFLMYLTGSNLVFKVYLGVGFNTTPVWTYTTPNTASTFETDASYGYCNGDPNRHQGWYSLTNYIEIHSLSSGMSASPWNWWFEYTNAAWWGGSTWTVAGLPDSSYGKTCMGSSCPTEAQTYYMVFYSGGGTNRWMTIADEAYEYWDGVIDFTVAPGGTAHDTGYTSGDGSYCTGTVCPIALTGSGVGPLGKTDCNWPSGWAGSFTFQTGYIVGSSYTADFYAYPPSTASAGLYIVTCEVAVTANSPSQWTSHEFFITVT